MFKLFLSSSGSDLLLRPAVADLVARLDQAVADRMQRLPAKEGLELLKELQAQLAREKEFEEEISAAYARLEEELESARDGGELARVQAEFSELAARYFRHRGSVPAFFSLSNGYRDLIARRVFALAEKRVAERGLSCSRHAWIASGRCARDEQMFFCTRDDLLVFADRRDGEGYRTCFAAAVELFREMGIVSRSAIGERAAAVSEWEIILGNCLNRGGCDIFADATEIADLRFLAGDPAIGEELLQLARRGIEQHPELLRKAARSAATMPLAIRFLGLLRLERSGVHRGMLNLRQYALQPLMANVRVLALMNGIWDPDTPHRIRRLLEARRLDVSLAEQLLSAYFHFCRLQLDSYVHGKCRGDDCSFVAPELLADDDAQLLREGLEAVSILQKIIYSDSVELG